MTTRLLARLSFVVLSTVLPACPGPSGNTITSVDGLSGGALSSKLTVPGLTVEGSSTLASVTATSATIDELTVTTNVQAASVSSTTVITQSIAAEAASIDSLSATEATVTSLVLPPVVSEPPSAVDNGGVLGNLLGATSSGGPTLATGTGYTTPNDACVAEFGDESPHAHVCSDFEVLRFARSNSEAIALKFQSAGAAGASLDGASYVTMSHAVVGFNSSSAPIVADDCGGWSVGLVATPDPESTHARHLLRVFSVDSDQYVARPETTNNCSFDAIRFLCCG